MSCGENSSSKKIYKDFNDWWSHGNHGWSSASLDVAKEIWEDLEPTILAGRDDYVNLLLYEINNNHNRYIDHLRDTMEYLECFSLEEKAGIKFYRWLLNKRLGILE